MNLKYQDLFDEVKTTQEDRIMQDASKYYDTLIELQTENYGYYEKNKLFFDQTQLKFNKYLLKFKEHQKKLQLNYQELQNAYDSGNFVSQNFIKINVDEIYKLPETIKLPSWFTYFKEEEFEKVKSQLNAYGSRLYRSKVTETLLNNRKKIEKRIELLIFEIEEKYREPDQLPIIKINELQHYIEELQAVDRVIPEICYEIMHKASEYARGVVNGFVEFRHKSSEIIQNIY